MRHLHLAVLSFALLGLSVPTFASADVLYNNLTPTNQMAVASRPNDATFEIESGDDFILSATSQINHASFTGLIVPGASGTPSVSEVVVEIYRIFPNDSDSVRTINVPTRANSPSDVAFDARDSSAAGQLTFSSSQLAGSFTALNSVQAGGIHPIPGQTTGGNGPVTGGEFQIDVTFSSSINLPADHYFFVPQVSLTSGGSFYWLSASRPISGAGTTAISPDLQMWTRDASLDPDWLRVGTDIVGGATPPTFNASFSLEGAVPEPGSIAVLTFAIPFITLRRGR